MDLWERKRSLGQLEVNVFVLLKTAKSSRAQDIGLGVSVLDL